MYHLRELIIQRLTEELNKDKFDLNVLEVLNKLLGTTSSSQ